MIITEEEKIIFTTKKYKSNVYVRYFLSILILLILISLLSFLQKNTAIFFIILIGLIIVTLSSNSEISINKKTKDINIFHSLFGITFRDYTLKNETISKVSYSQGSYNDPFNHIFLHLKNGSSICLTQSDVVQDNELLPLYEKIKEYLDVV